MKSSHICPRRHMDTEPLEIIIKKYIYTETQLRLILELRELRIS